MDEKMPTCYLPAVVVMHACFDMFTSLHACFDMFTSLHACFDMFTSLHECKEVKRIKI